MANKTHGTRQKLVFRAPPPQAPIRSAKTPAGRNAGAPQPAPVRRQPRKLIDSSGS